MLYNTDNLTFSLLSVSKLSWKGSNNTVLPRPFSALSLHTKGSGEFLVNGKTHIICPGDIIYMPSGMGYDVKYTDGEIIVIHFANENYAAASPECYPSTPEINELFYRALETFENEACTYDTVSLIYSLLSALRKNSMPGENSSALSYAVKLMHENFKNPEFKVSGISKKCGICPASLREKFNREYNMPPVKYLENLRLSHAVKLLSGGSFTVEEVSFMSGFSDSKYFSRVIKKAYGVSPSRLFRKI